ncbi:MAG: hypothetical protein KA956_04480 [Pyrinomonadaceae bacterium]|nr:hypothetical protein [Acidobacteriota bacterium]MBK7933775.1 hypothetical protein [Acidobacteriota bacterium]MBP7375709.1 hypothetical protein [Pyrinomonadaceae bacterium]
MKKRISITASVALAMLFGTALLPQTTSASPSLTSTPLFQDNCVVTGNDDRPLRVRSTPGGRVIGSLKIGTQILAYNVVQDSYGNDWTRIKYRRGFGYVSTQFISCG